MKEINLNKGMVSFVDDCDYDFLVNLCAWRVHYHRHTYYVVGRKKSKGKTKEFFMHRVILGLIGSTDIIDHADGNGLNNTRSNLRICTTTQNSQNKRKPKNGKSSIYKGVMKNKRNRYRNWTSYITVNKKCIFLGSFLTEIDAANAYDNAARLYFGEFARTNL